MSSIIRFFSAVDTFPVKFNPSIRPSENSAAYKSPLGGIIGILIYSFGLFYSVGLLKRWFNSEMVMKVSSQLETYMKDNYQYIFNNSGIINRYEIQIYSDSDEMDDPFMEDENIMLPMMINFTDGSIFNILYYHEASNQTLQIVLNDSLEYNFFYLFFVPCIGNEQFLSSGQKCASQEKSDKFYSHPGLEISINLFSYMMDLYTKEISKTDLSTSLFIQDKLRQDLILILDYSYFEIHQGILFQTSESLMLQTNFDVNNHYLEAGYLDHTLVRYINDDETLFNVLGSIVLTTGANINHVVAEYPTISEVLASIGSTIQTLLLVKYIIFLFNEYRMVSDFKDFFRELYFPEIKQVSISGKGKNKQCFLGKRQLDPSDYKKFLKKIDSKLEDKMNFANLIYEISRMQIVLQEIASNETNIRSHLKRSALKFELDQTSNLYKINNSMCHNDYNHDLWLDPQFDPFIYSYTESQHHVESQRKIGSCRVMSLDQQLNSEEIYQVYSVRQIP